MGVVTVNMARLGYLYAQDEAALTARLDELMEVGRDTLELKRDVISTTLTRAVPLHQALPGDHG